MGPGPGPGALCFEMCLTGTFLEKQNVTSDSHVGSGTVFPMVRKCPKNRSDAIYDHIDQKLVNFN